MEENQKPVDEKTETTEELEVVEEESEAESTEE